VGTIDAGFYINNCLGFSYPIPEGWEINNEILGTSPGAAKHDGGGLILLIVDQHTKRSFFNRMVLSAINASAMTFDTAEFVSRFVHPQNNGDQPGRKILKEPYAVDVAGKPFFRSDFTDQHADVVLYKTFLSTNFPRIFSGMDDCCRCSRRIRRRRKFSEQKGKCSLSIPRPPGAITFKAPLYFAPRLTKKAMSRISLCYRAIPHLPPPPSKPLSSGNTNHICFRDNR